MTPEAKAYYESLGNYCYAGLCTPVSAVEFRAVGPAPGETCGDVLNETVVQQPHCCDGVIPVTVDEDNSAYVLPHGGSASLFINDGKAPYTFHITGQNVFFDSGLRYKVTNNMGVGLYASLDFCGTAEVTVEDSCGFTDSFVIMSDMGYWLRRTDVDCVLSEQVADSYTMLPNVSYWEARLEKRGWRVWENQMSTYANESFTGVSFQCGGGLDCDDTVNYGGYKCVPGGFTMQEAVACVLTLWPGSDNAERPCLAAKIAEGAQYNPLVELREEGRYKDWGIYVGPNSQYACCTPYPGASLDYYIRQFIAKGPVRTVWSWEC
jgi:hypothetical protein